MQYLFWRNREKAGKALRKALGGVEFGMDITSDGELTVVISAGEAVIMDAKALYDLLKNGVSVITLPGKDGEDPIEVDIAGVSEQIKKIKSGGVKEVAFEITEDGIPQLTIELKAGSKGVKDGNVAQLGRENLAALLESGVKALKFTFPVKDGKEPETVTVDIAAVVDLINSKLGNLSVK